MSNSNNNSNETETNEDNYEEHDEDIPLIKIPDEMESHKSRHRESDREHTRGRERARDREPEREHERDRHVRKLSSTPPGKSSLKRQESNEKYTPNENSEEKKVEKKVEKPDSPSFFSKYRWYILFLFILLCIGIYFLWTKKLKMMFQSGGVSTNISNQTLDLNILDSMNKNI